MSPSIPWNGDLPALPVPISNPEKVLWPEEGYTRQDLANYYLEVFPAVSSFLADRLLALERCPDGMAGQCFYQREKPSGMPPETPTMLIEHQKSRTNYVVGGALATQIALVNLGCIAIHIWNARRLNPRKPDWVCFDLDPDSGLFEHAVGAAYKLKNALDALNLISFVKTSGKRGLHVFVPLHPDNDVDEVRAFADHLSHRLSLAFPKELTMEPRIAARKGRVYLDSFRNGFGQTVVAPYSVRHAAGAPISTPLAWADLTPMLKPVDFNIGNYRARLHKPDPWADFFQCRQDLSQAQKSISLL